jgi:hypothetical protein
VRRLGREEGREGISDIDKDKVVTGVGANDMPHPGRTKLGKPRNFRRLGCDRLTVRLHHCNVITILSWQEGL